MEKYVELMKNITLSQSTKASIRNDIIFGEKERSRKISKKRVALVFSICLLLSCVAVFAINSIFDEGYLRIIRGNAYRVQFKDVENRPITDFNEEIRSIDGEKRVAYNTLEEAEKALGFDIVTNDIISSGTPSYHYSLEKDDFNVHCFTKYEGIDGSLFRAKTYASYRIERFSVEVEAIVTAEHDAIAPEAVESYHFIGHSFGNNSNELDSISNEEYKARSGLPANIIRIDWKGDINDIWYEAVFHTNATSYLVRLSGISSNNEDKARDLLFDILEGFSF